MTPQRRHATPRRLETVTDIETIVGRPAPMIMLKELSALDEGCRTVLAHSPIAAVGYRDSDGTSRTTFVGGAPGFARALSTTRISFSLPGTSDPHGPVSLFFLLPGVGEILRVNGTAAGRKGAQTSVDITQAWVHCAQAVLRSGLWNPPTTPSVPTHRIEGDGPLAGPGIADFLAAAPFLALSSWDAAGGSDTSPRGDQQTVARILDDRTLVIADRKGNKRADTLHNLLQDGHLSLAALVPGRRGVLHVRGRAAITDDPALVETMALRGMSPHLALLIDVEHAEVNGNDALVRSRLWNPGAHPDRATMPDLMALGAEHLAANAAGADGGPPAFLLKAVGAIPGMNRLLRWGIDRAYRSGLRKEGYGDIQPGAGAHRGIRRRRPTDVGTGEPSLRQVRVAEVRRRPRARSRSCSKTPAGTRNPSTSGPASTSRSSPTSTAARCGGPTRPRRHLGHPDWRSPSSTSRTAGSPPTYTEVCVWATASRCAAPRAPSTLSSSPRTTPCSSPRAAA